MPLALLGLYFPAIICTTTTELDAGARAAPVRQHALRRRYEAADDREKTVIKFAKLLFAAGALGLGLLAEPALAGTPKDTLVIAKQIDDIITLDPAEVFEFTGGEVIANVYDRIMTYE